MRLSLTIVACVAAVSLAGCFEGPKGEKGDPGAPGVNGNDGQQGEKGDPGSTKAGSLDLRVITSATAGSRASCGPDEIMVSASCMTPTGSTTLAPTTTNGMSAECKGARQSSAIAVILCAKR